MYESMNKNNIQNLRCPENIPDKLEDHLGCDYQLLPFCQWNEMERNLKNCSNRHGAV